MDPATLIVLGGIAVLALARRRPRTSSALGAQGPRGGPGGGGSIPFPEPIPARDAFILDAVKNGAAEVRWAFVRSSVQGHTGEFRVLADALKIDGVRVNLTAVGQQHVADALVDGGAPCMLLTTKLADLLWSQRQVEIPPFEMSQTAHDLQIMSTVARMVEHSAKIDAALATLPQPPEGVVSTVGKHWILDDRLADPKHRGMACNYGWHNKKQGPMCATPAGVLPPGGAPCHVVQDPGFMHNIGHSDYSQTCTLVSRACTIDGHPADLAQVLSDPVLSFLASHTGRMKVLRQPGS